MSPSVGCPEGLSWEHGAHLTFNEPPAWGLWHELVCGEAGGRWCSCGGLLISVEGSVLSGRAVMVVADALRGSQREGGLSWWSQREDSEKGLAAGQGKGWAGVALGTALQKWDRAPGPAWFQLQVAKVGQSVEMATVTGAQAGASTLVMQAANPAQCACVGLGVGAGSQPLEALAGSLTALGRLWAMVACCLGTSGSSVTGPHGLSGQQGRDPLCWPLWEDTVSSSFPDWVVGKVSQGARMGLHGGLRNWAQGTGR